MGNGLRRFKALLPVAGLVLLVACGGGGSAGTTPPPPSEPPAANTGLLAFSPDNVGRVAGYPLWSTELMFRLGQLVSDDIATAPGQRSLGGCPSGGNLQREWSDKDGSKTVSAGDELSLNYTACSRDPLTRGMDGRVTVTLISAEPNGDFDARLVISAPGVAIGYTTGLPGRSDFRITGQLRLTVSRTELRQSLTIGDSTDTAISIGFPGSSFGPDRMTALRISKTHRWDEARTYIDLQMRFDSPEIGGAFNVATMAPLKSWLDTVPEPGPQQGEIRMLGRGGDEARVQVAVGGAPDYAEIGGWLDQGGDGNREAQLTGSWLSAGIASGVFFADYTRWGRGNAYGYNPNEFTIRPAFVDNSALPTNSTFTFQFTRPVAGATNWRWRLLDKGRLDQLPSFGTEVPVEVEVIGAQIKVRPLTPLLYSRRYQLRVDTGEPSTNGQLMRATTGGTLSIYDGYIGEFTTPDYLNPQSTLVVPQTLKAGAPLEVAGLALPADTYANVRYQWTQVSGTPLTISQPGERVTVIALAAGARGIGSSTVRLTVSMDGTDQKESADFVLRTVADTSDPWFSRLRVPIDSSDWYARPKEFWIGPSVGSLTASLREDRISLVYVERADPAHPNGDWRIELRSADGRPLQPGRYANAYSSTWYQRPANGVPTLDVFSGSYAFSSVQGEFVIHELQVDDVGNISRLALDFVAPQNDTGPVTSSGSVRIGSGWALPP
jgi:hypothetical protein